MCEFCSPSLLENHNLSISIYLCNFIQQLFYYFKLFFLLYYLYIQQFNFIHNNTNFSIFFNLIYITYDLECKNFACKFNDLLSSTERITKFLKYGCSFLSQSFFFARKFLTK